MLFLNFNKTRPIQTEKENIKNYKNKDKEQGRK